MTPSSRRTTRTLLLWGALVIGLVGVCWWPGDVKWVNDEPTIIYRAWQANRAGQLAMERVPHGHLGVSYHQVGIWYYQPLLLLSDNLIAVAFWKMLLASGLTVGGAWLLCRQLGLSRWLALLVLILPQPWLHNRQLWDNVQLIPLGLWLGVCLVDLARHRRARGWYGGLAVAVWMFHIHLMSTMILAAWALTMLVANGRWLRDHWRHTVAGLLLAGLVSLPFLIDVFQGLINRPEQPRDVTFWMGLWTGVHGWRSLTLKVLDFWVPEIRSPWFALPALVVTAGIWLSMLALPLALSGAWGAVVQLARAWRGRRHLTPRQAMALFAIATILVTVVGYGAMRVAPVNHYYNGIWFAWAYLLWLGLRRHWPQRLGRGVIGAWAVATVLLVGLTASFLHANGGTRAPTFGPTLATQLEAARTVVQYSPTPGGGLHLQVDMYQRYPELRHAFIYLVEIAGADAPEVRPRATVYVTHREELPPISGAIRTRVVLDTTTTTDD